MEEKELEELAFALQIGQLVLQTAKSIIKDENLLRSNGVFAIDSHKFEIKISEVSDEQKEDLS
ncbi:hypothetical protein [Streptococcus oralis]|uniref:Uncharacterized protein n=1 Tax=Streptococcus oralis subsp. oralis TaxID=1891914 RepID=A0A1X1GL21_STROR|nr:hypothetical protein [Streptococcus oralis]ORO47551.1 hypothetical protein B7723_09640 [Streptococcus oralis subsp. oralis]ORO71873.1 hypothetical protein B7712_04260 [Streptococcus oralis subsp. oralis]